MLHPETDSPGDRCNLPIVPFPYLYLAAPSLQSG